jgi:GH15 family glucan-1,4-alpha-glucosidase
MTLQIEYYAMIGNCKTAASVRCHSSIHWLCWPRFDAAACFATLVGKRTMAAGSLRQALPARNDVGPLAEEFDR